MNANSLPLPVGLAWAMIVDDMRELCQFDIKTDCFVWRWDTLVHGVKQTQFAEQPATIAYADHEWAAEKRKEIKTYFQRIELGMPPK